jgi:predicted AAA+ superfamily ATPase
MVYLPRIVDQELESRLRAAGAVVLEGPKACGKTATARQLAASEALLDVDPAVRAAAAVDPALVLDGPAPRLLDEWQLEPALWNHVRRAVDDRGEPGQFILTGSAVPADEITRHTGAGRINRIRMRPMSLFESGSSSGQIRLDSLLDAEPPRARDAGHSLRDIVDRICIGGWPALQSLAPADAQAAANGYLDEIARTDVQRVDGVRRDPARVTKTLQSVARNVATSAAVTKIAADTRDGDGEVHRKTVAADLAALTRLFVVEDQPAWRPHLRSRVQLRTSPNRHFVDPSLAVAALGASPETLLADLNYLGYLFESLVVRDLRIYAQHADASVSYYRDSTGLEVDAVVEARNGRWAAFEIKLGGDAAIEGAARSLLRFAGRIDTRKRGEPARLGVIVATGLGYVRDDGVAVIPIGALGP